MQGSPTRERNGNPATASRNPAEAASPPRGAMESMEAVQNLVQMLLGHGIDSSVPAPGHTGSKIRLPLQYFDNVDMERNTPQGWVEQSTKQRAKRGIQPTAIVLLTDESGVGQWRLGRVFHWDEKTSTYHVHLANALRPDRRGLERRAAPPLRLLPGRADARVRAARGRSAARAYA